MDYNNLLTTINQYITTNGNNEVTAAIVRNVLAAMVRSLGAGYQFMGIATPNTNPGTPDQRVFYLATESGTYTYFGNTVISALSVLMWDTTWSVQTLGSGGGGGGGSIVALSNVATEGTRIATITIDNNPTDIKAPSALPNNEDINLNANNRLQFANRTSATGKKGYVILRADASFSSQITQSNTIYEVRYNFDLGSREQIVSLPANCILLFNGGRITNGNLECADGTEIYNGNFLNCPLLVRGNFKIYDSVLLINSNSSTQRDGCIIAEYGAADSSLETYIEIARCRITLTVHQNVYGVNVKLIADNHNIRFDIHDNFISGIYNMGIETQSRFPGDSGYVYDTYCSGNCCNNTVIMAKPSNPIVTDGIGISFVARNSNVRIMDNYVESWIYGIEFCDNAIISGNTIKMSDANRYAITTSIPGGSAGVTISNNKVLVGRVSVVRTECPFSLIGNEISGTVFLDGELNNGASGLGRFIIRDNIIRQDENDLEWPVLLIRDNSSSGIVEGNYIHDKHIANPYMGPMLIRAKNTQIKHNTFVFSGGISRPILIWDPVNVDFSDNHIQFTSLSSFSSTYAPVDVEKNSSATPSIRIQRNIYEIGNLSAVLASNVDILPVRDVYNAVPNIYEEDTTIIGINERKVGTTAQRQSLGLYKGISKYFDTTLMKQLWWQYPDWHDSTGTVV